MICSGQMSAGHSKKDAEIFGLTRWCFSLQTQDNTCNILIDSYKILGFKSTFLFVCFYLKNGDIEIRKHWNTKNQINTKDKKEEKQKIYAPSGLNLCDFHDTTDASTDAKM